MTTNADIAKLVAELCEPFDHSDIAAAMEKALLMQQAALALERSGPSAEAVRLAEIVIHCPDDTYGPTGRLLAREILHPSAERAEPVAFQFRVAPWMQECFGPVISADVIERNHRFLEESLELVQSTGCTSSEAHQLVDYVYGRPQGVAHQEVGGVQVTLAALCLAVGLDMHMAGEDELARIWTNIEKIRAKQAAKPPHSALPASPPAPGAEPVAVVINNNQRGGEHIVECKPNITLDVGTKLYASPPAPDAGPQVSARRLCG